MLSIIPPTPQQRLQGPNETKLKAANGTDISCYGTTQRTITIGQQDFSFEFVIADIQSRILGADFLATNYLAPNHRDALLINLKDYSTLPAQHARGFNSIPINFVHQIDDPFYKLLDQFPEVTTPSFTIKQPDHDVRHHIPTGDSPPVQSRARRLDPEKLSVAKAELEKLVDLGVCYRGKSEWSSPLLVTTKPNGGWRVCGDYRRLNNLTTDDRYPVRSLQDFTAELNGKSIFSKIDLMKGYHQIPVADGDIKKTAVITPFGLFVFPRTPFGLKNAGQDFQRLMDQILGDLPRVYVYIDDILVASESPEQHLKDLEEVFKTLSANGLVLQRSKCVLGVPELEFLGYKVNSTGITPLPDRVVAIRATTPPTTIKELQRFLGMVGYYRRFIPKAAAHLYHLFEALKGKPKTLTWTPECQLSFEATKEALANASLLFHPRAGAQLALTTDASNSAVGGVLEQRGPDGWEPLAFYSSKLKPNEQMWPPYDRELLGAFKGIRHFKEMIEGRAFTLYTDHQSLIPSLSKKTDSHTARQIYQLSCIAEYTTDIRYVQGKANLVADALSRPNETVEDVSDINTVTNPISNPSEKNGPNFQAACRPNQPTSSMFLNNTTPLPSLATNATTGSAASTAPEAIAGPGRSTTSSSENRKIASAAKLEAATEDLACVVNAIGDMGMDWEEVARQQPLDPEFKRLRDEARSGLNFKSVDIGRHNLIVDVSNGFPRPYIPFESRKRVFDLIHGLGHPGVERTRQAVAAKVVWPSMRQDVSNWARNCISCQRSKVTRHTVPPIGDFEVPNRRFLHLNMDIVTLPLSNGFRYLLTAVDRFTRWPVAIPLTDITAESVVTAFSHGWVQTFGVPVAITTDRGSQFSSTIFSQLNKVWGIKHLMTAPYHPEANGLVERFHRRLKESLIALGSDSPNDWFWRLPCALLAIRTTLKPDVGASPADLVFGEGLAIPGEALPDNPATDPQLSRQRASALADLRLEVARLQPVPTSAHRRPTINMPQELSTCTHVFVRRGGVQSTLSAPYVGPFRVISRDNQNFKIAAPGRSNEVVAISRVKPAFTTFDDGEDARPPSPPPPGRRPGPRQPPDDPQLPPRRNRRRRRPRSIEVQDRVPASPPPPSTPEGSPVRRSRSRRRPQRIVSNDEMEPSLRASPPIESDDEYFGDADPAPPISPMPLGPPTDWFSPPASPERPVDPHADPPADLPVMARNPPRRRLLSNPMPGHFSHRPAPAAGPQHPPHPPASQHVPKSPPRPRRSARLRTLSKGGRFSRPRPDVNALHALLKGHLDLPDSPHPVPTSDDSFENRDSFFPDFTAF